MEVTDGLWLVIFVVIITTTNFLLTLIRRYFAAKPIGSQSLFDAVLVDTFSLAQLAGTKLPIENSRRFLVSGNNCTTAASPVD